MVALRMSCSCVGVVVGGDGAGRCSSCWGLWPAGGYRPAVHESVLGVITSAASNTHVYAGDLGMLLSGLRRWLICGLLGRCEICPSLTGSRVLRRPAILWTLRLWPLWLKALVVLALVLGKLLVGCVGMVGRHLSCIKGSRNASVRGNASTERDGRTNSTKKFVSGTH